MYTADETATFFDGSILILTGKKTIIIYTRVRRIISLARNVNLK